MHIVFQVVSLLNDAWRDEVEAKVRNKIDLEDTLENLSHTLSKGL